MSESECCGDAVVEEAEVNPEVASEESAEVEGAEWFVIHTYSGYENKVCENLTKRIHSMAMEDRIFQVLVPTEDEIEFTKDGRRRSVQKKIYPGYVLINMIMDDQSWFVVRNTPGVTSFVSPTLSTSKPVPLPKDEVARVKQLMGLEAPKKVKISLEVGQSVRIIHGPLENSCGTVVEVDADREKAKVLVSMFGRETPVEVDFGCVEKQSLS